MPETPLRRCGAVWARIMDSVSVAAVPEPAYDSAFGDDDLGYPDFLEVVDDLASRLADVDARIPDAACAAGQTRPS